MDISIIGSGHVGLVTGACFADLGNNVICIDKDQEKINNLANGNIPFYEPGLEEIVRRNIKNNRLSFKTSIKEAVDNSSVIFITVGTPPKVDGEANLIYVENVATEIAKHLKEYKLIVEKSTVPVHTGNWVKHTININLEKQVEFDVASNPEFLSEGNAIKDFLEPDRVVIGIESKKAESILKELYKPLKTPIIVTDITSAELIKHASNSFLATKISFINTVAEICEKTGANIEKVSEGMGLDSRIGKKFLNAGIGYGGSCFPKDVEAFIYITEKKGLSFDILKAVKDINIRQCDRFIKKIKNLLWIVEDKTIAVWGLSFKPGTDDIREAPSLKILEALIKENAKIKVYDPQVKTNKHEVLSSVEFCKNIYDAVDTADCLLILTEWNEFKEADFKKVKKLLKQPLVFDGRNIYELKKMKDLGFKYISIGRNPVNLTESKVK